MVVVADRWVEEEEEIDMIVGVVAEMEIIRIMAVGMTEDHNRHRRKLLLLYRAQNVVLLLAEVS